MKHLYLAGLLLTACRFACAGEADVLAADVSCSSDTVCSFSVTLQHEDEGWDHFERLLAFHKKWTAIE